MDVPEPNNLPKPCHLDSERAWWFSLAREEVLRCLEDSQGNVDVRTSCSYRLPICLSLSTRLPHLSSKFPPQPLSSTRHSRPCSVGLIKPLDRLRPRTSKARKNSWFFVNGGSFGVSQFATLLGKLSKTRPSPSLPLAITSS